MPTTKKRGRPRLKGRDAFSTALEKATAFLPSGYGTLLRARRPDLDLQHIYHVRHGKALDWDVLEELQKLSDEYAPQSVAA